MEQQAYGLGVWMQPMVPLRMPRLFNLRSDPFERAQQEAGDYVRAPRKIDFSANFGPC
jgi:arylsulfatase